MLKFFLNSWKIIIQVITENIKFIRMIIFEYLNKKITKIDF